MSCKQKTENTSFLFVVSVYFYTFLVCYSVSLGQREEGLTDYQVQESAATLERIKQQDDVQLGNWRLVEQVISDPNVRVSTELQPEPAAFPGEPLPYFNVPKLGDTDSNWTIGDLNRQPRSEDKYQADFTGFGGVQGNVLGPSFDSTPHFSEWVAMRPLVQCDDNVMTFTASGHGFAHLLVDREGTSPMSLFQLPSYCGYLVRMSWSDLEMMVPYDACYITQENGSYVLPMLWWGSPLKLSCPVQMSTSAPSLSPLVYCSPYNIAVQIDGQEQDIAMLGIIVNGRWGPFVSQEYVHRVYSNPEQLAFFISYSAPCITDGDGPHIHLILDKQEYVLSCPASAQVPYIPSPPLSPDDHQFLQIPDPVGAAPTSPPPPPPQLPTQEQIAQLPNYPHYPGFQYPQFPQVYPPGPQPGHPAQPTPGSPPGSQPQQQQQSLYPSGPGKLPYSPGEPPKYPSLLHHPRAVFQALSSPDLSPSLDISPHQVSKFPAGPSQHQSGMYYPNVPFYYPAVTPDTTTTTAPPATQPPEPLANLYPPQYYLQIPYYPAPTAAPVTQAPASLPPSPPSTPSPQFPYPSHATVIPPLTTTATTTMVPKQPGSHSYSFSQFYNQRPIYVPPTTPQPSAKEESPTIPQEPQKPAAPQASCPPYAHTICGNYPYHYFPYYHHMYLPYYHPPYPPVPQYPATPMTTTKPPTSTTTKPVTSTTTTSSTAAPLTETTPQIPHLQCLMGKMVVFLPFAHRDSIQVRDQMESWLFLSSVSPLCGYMLQMAEDSGVILHSPLPACHSEPRTPTTISLPLRFWDLSIAKYRTLDLQCPYQMIPETPAPVTAPVTPSVSPAPPSTTVSKVSPSVVPKPQVFCSSDQMTVELSSGLISGIVVKDIKGNHMNLQDAPKHCGYSARKGKDGKLRLSLQLHSRCHMSVQGQMYIITIVYMTVNGRREAQFFCPVLIPRSGQECNLPSEQRLPCGPGSVSQPQCLSMGCCFSKQPPACYYPIDECTIDRHFVFSVPASLTDPPLSPALLVTAGNSTCKPLRVTSDYALFKIPMDGCGTRRVMVGKTMIYIVEVINKVQAISLNYGTITRDSPVRLLVECRYLPSPVLSVSYMVKSPTLGPAVQTQWVYGVQLRISKDAQYSSYYPQYHQPLQMLLGKPLYLEVRLLNSPDPSLVLLVHFCVAYPRSGKAVWLLLYNGCPNPLDPAPQQAVLFDPQPPSSQAQTRRFTISTFQFLPDGEFKDPDEEIYFMCSTEICAPRDGPCVEGCFGQ